jgi:hypothetical protein
MDDLRASTRFNDATFKPGLLCAKFAKEMGTIVTLWPHVEEGMIAILRALLGGHATAPARQIFRSIVSERARIQMMTTLLQKTYLNQTKGNFYDDVIAEFDRLNGKRNAYVHGLWWTREDGRLFLTNDLVGDHHFYRSREVPFSEIRETVSGMKRLLRNLAKFERNLSIWTNE